MAITATVKDNKFGVGDVVKVHQLLTEGEKSRTQIFEGMVIGIRGKGMGKSFIVRRIGAANIGIEQIIPLESPLLQKIEVVREGVRGSRQAKLYYTRNKSKREIENIYTRSKRRGSGPDKPAKKVVRKTAAKKTAKKATKKSAPKKASVKKASAKKPA